MIMSKDKKGSGYEMSKRSIVLRIRVSEEEYNDIYREAVKDLESQYRNGEINLSAYLRKCLLRGKDGWMEEAYRKELRDLTYQVRKIGVNINQVVRQLNSGYQSQYAVKELIEGMKDVGKQFEKTQARFQQIDGSVITPSKSFHDKQEH